MWSYCTSRQAFSVGLMNKNHVVVFQPIIILPDTCQTLWLYPTWEMGKERKGEREEGNRGSETHLIQAILSPCSASDGRKS